MYWKVPHSLTIEDTSLIGKFSKDNMIVLEAKYQDVIQANMQTKCQD